MVKELRIGVVEYSSVNKLIMTLSLRVNNILGNGEARKESIAVSHDVKSP